jgi:2-methylisocitrate lyase-like PEP mutase family enzyme
MPDTSSQRAAFRKLHQDGCFVIPNPWDIGSAKYLKSLGFRALATSSAGFGFSRGLPDSVTALPRDAVVQHVGEIVAATDLPVNADFQSGYADSAAGVAKSVRLCVETGMAGLSIEDSTGRREQPLYELPEAVDRLRAARAAIDATGADVLLTGRAECFLVKHPDALRESVRRLQAYAEAGADVLFAPGVSTRDQIRTIVSSVSPKPVNVLVSSNIGLRVNDLAELGVRRISVGSALARAAWTGFIRAARKVATEGSFEGLEGLTSFDELNSLFGPAR